MLFNSRKVILSLIAVTFFINDASATRKIYLHIDTNNHSFITPYEIIYPEDTAFIRFTSSSDMGYTWYHYRIKLTAPADTYYIYVNNLLDSKGYFKNGSKEGRWIEYEADRSFLKAYYHNHNLYGMYEKYDKKGRLYESEYIDTLYGNTIKTEYYEDGKVASNEFWLNGTWLCGEAFTAMGRLEYMYHRDANNPMTGCLILYSGGAIHGKIKKEYKSGAYELKYEWNKITEWSYYDSSFKKVTTKFPTDKKE